MNLAFGEAKILAGLTNDDDFIKNHFLNDYKAKSRIKSPNDCNDYYWILSNRGLYWGYPQYFQRPKFLRFLAFRRKQNGFPIVNVL